MNNEQTPYPIITFKTLMHGIQWTFQFQELYIWYQIEWESNSNPGHSLFYSTLTGLTHLECMSPFIHIKSSAPKYTIIRGFEIEALFFAPCSWKTRFRFPEDLIFASKNDDSVREVNFQGRNLYFGLGMEELNGLGYRECVRSWFRSRKSISLKIIWPLPRYSFVPSKVNSFAH